MLKTNHFIINNGIFLKKLIPTLTETTGEPSLNQYWFDKGNTNGPTIKINSAAGVFGAINFPVFNLKKRDKIRVICEIKSESGVLPKLALDKATGGNVDNTNTYTYPAGEWVQFDETFNITTGDKDFKVMCGLFTNDVGIFSIRNFKIIVYSDSCLTLPDERIYAFKKTGETWEIDTSKCINSGALTVLNNDTLQLVFDKPFNYFGIPVVFEGQDSASAFRAVTGTVSKANLFIKFKNVDGSNAKLADLPTNFWFYLRILQVY
ncbi:hypothetical protein ACWOEQ_10875 [Enterococcus asini]|uniref:hypothetical protein n=1 Tax=Enterococcus asini TaxID=57732 RepID=UPI000900317A|nr:hypothetical protein [Enterococcus asini]OJG13006.1 hypothetical protein RU94_GL001705 [Enterococcus asini]